MAPSKKRNRRRRTAQPAAGGWYRRFLRGADPPAFNPVPWNRAIIKVEWSTPADNLTMSINELTTAIHNQQGVTPPTGYFTLVKLQGMAIWDLEGRSLEAVFYDLDDLQDTVTERFHHTLSERYDNSGRNKWAHVSFVWPKDNRNNVLSSGVHANAIICNIRYGTESQSEVVRVVGHVAVLWRMGIPVEAPTLSSPTSLGFRSCVV